LGTEDYKAPEIHQKKPYSGAAVDLFACAIMLFNMVTMLPPFKASTQHDPYYRCFVLNRPEVFWLWHARGKKDGANFIS
jgi:serine/threonine protein kinase